MWAARWLRSQLGIATMAAISGKLTHASQLHNYIARMALDVVREHICPFREVVLG